MKSSNQTKPNLNALKLLKSDMKKIKGGAKETFDRNKPNANVQLGDPAPIGDGE